MVKSKRQRYEQIREEIEKKAESGSIDETDKEYLFEFLDAKDPECGLVNDPNDKPKSDGTISRYAYSLKRIADLGDFDLTDCSPDDINYLCDDMRQGRIEGVKDDGLTKGSVANYQKALRKFYEYHDDLGIEKQDIILYKDDSGGVDERDIFDKQDIKALRDACKHPRDRALVDLLLYTGQRLSAILNLRIKDIDLETAEFYLNEEAGDLKGASGKRPLLYAEKAVRDWMNSHPCKNDPEAYFITQKSKNLGGGDYELGDRIDNSTVYHQLQQIKKEAGVDKPCNAHNFRHTFVTLAARDYGLDFDYIKHLIGHAPDSQVMESTYTHLTDDDIINKAKEATGIKEKEEESPLTPDICENCNEPVPIDNAKACPACGIAFTPDAHQAKEQIEEDLYESKGQAEGQLEEDTDTLRQKIKENPELEKVALQALIENNPELLDQ
ncbi:tyrosine-type recombinase/integrase [Natronolimnohabitans sp. A-GB9]|uniref:tyrosine-type recombinase/integrase n=1 Tax=Natronolimnohabitans sp. A-GB9 TaxID=3069757 RepID=UPI0027AF12CC|nr:tyrosine-type recombinase/integrase [Natronolimnohabitans sp. A-GB9]MDQ2051873.1 tyrosine-type recombinase/integrase [Natronolimnohabitans sp. A-GB9]